MGASVESFGQRLLDTDGMEVLFDMTYDSSISGYAKHYNGADRNFLGMIEKLKGYRYLFTTKTHGTINPTASSNQTGTRTRFMLFGIDKEEMQHAYDFVSRRYSTSTNYKLIYTMNAMNISNTGTELSINFTGTSSGADNYFNANIGDSDGTIKIYGIK